MNPFHCHRHEPAGSRREFLSKWGMGFGSLPLIHLLERESFFRTASAKGTRESIPHPLAPKPPHQSASGRNVVFIYLQGGASHVDTLDPKPALTRYDGQNLPQSFASGDLNFANIAAGEAKLMGSDIPFRRYGESGLEISDLMRKVATHADDLAVVRSCYHDSFVHGPATNYLCTGSILTGHPSVGSWILYGLGSENDNLPAYMVMTDGNLWGRTNRNHFGSGFLPAIYQGTLLRSEGAPLKDLTPPQEMTPADQRNLLDWIRKSNRRHFQGRSDDTSLAARISNYELAFRMQTAAPELVDLSAEPDHIRRLYGLDQEKSRKFGRMCLLTRRMLERGVRFVHLISTDWDGHEQCSRNHWDNSRKVDQPIAGLLQDLKQRGLMESTLVFCSGEFGRTPFVQGKLGRDHHPYGFSCWMTGAGIQGGKAIGATDDLGMKATEDKVHVHDLHATILSLLGLDHEGLTYFFQGRDRRLTDVGGYNDLSRRLLQRS
jgi:hypothetical protein